ncbi:putative reverse transcriptase domain-containing protein [Tanacetum coccineum]
MHSSLRLDIRLLSYSIVRNPWNSLIPLSHGSFDVLVGMDRLPKRKFVIVYHEKVVRIPLKGDEILQVHGERTQGVVKTLLNTKERVKPRRVRAMAMTIQYGVRRMILTAQSEAFKQENVPLVGSEMDEAHASSYLVHPGADKKYYNLGDMYWWPRIEKDISIYVSKFYLRYLSENEKESPWILSLNFQGQSSEYDVIWVMVDRLTKLAHLLAIQEDFKIFVWKSPVLWVKIGESSLTGLELVQETTDKIKVDKTLRFVKEPVENSDREVKRLKCSRMVVVKVVGCFFSFGAVMLPCVPFCGQAKLLAVRYLVKVSWNSKCNFELTWVWGLLWKDKFPSINCFDNIELKPFVNSRARFLKGGDL